MNIQSKRQSLTAKPFETSRWMNPSVRNKLEKSWVPFFYKHVFFKIDEEPFAVWVKDETLLGTLLRYEDDYELCAEPERMQVNYWISIRSLYTGLSLRYIRTKRSWYR